MDASAIILASDLTSPEKAIRERAIATLSETQKQELSSILTKYPDMLKPLTENLSSKLALLQGSASVRWSDLLENEGKIITSVS